MQSSIVRGMPYATMVYDNWRANGEKKVAFPTVASEIGLAKAPVADGKIEITCHSIDSDEPAVRVNREVELVFKASDFTWLVFTSEPVWMKCVRDEKTDRTLLEVVDGVSSDHDNFSHPLVLRVALIKPCTSGQNPVYCHQDQMHPTALHLGQGSYIEILRQHANNYPGSNTTFSYDIKEQSGSVELKFDWDVRQMSVEDAEELGDTLSSTTTKKYPEFIAFALQHHLDMLPKNVSTIGNEIYCVASLLGPACLVQGSSWTMIDRLPEIDLRAPRQPEAQFLPTISKSLREDMQYTLPDYYRRGAADTYFSGKMLAKLGRIVLIADELTDICQKPKESGVPDECNTMSLPSKQELNDVVAELRRSVEVWVNGTAETPFVFDASCEYFYPVPALLWLLSLLILLIYPPGGGVVSCGCVFDGDNCQTHFPNCPAFSDPGLNFGNGKLLPFQLVHCSRSASNSNSFSFLSEF